MNSGRNRHRLTIQKKTETADAIGGTIETWVTDFSRWGHVRPLSGREVFEADQLQTRQSHMISLRFTSSISTQNRILHRSRLFHIMSVRNPDERERVTELGCMEEGI